MKAKITVEFIADNVCNPEDLTFPLDTLEKMVKMLIEEESLWGIVNDDWKVVKVEEIK